MPVDGPDDPEPPSSGHNIDTDFRGTTRSNATHASTIKPDAQLYCKGPGTEAKLSFLGHALMENRCGLIVGACLTQATAMPSAWPLREGRATRGPARRRRGRGLRRTRRTSKELKTMNVRSHVVENTPRRLAADTLPTRCPSCATRRRIHKRSEKAFGWPTTIRCMRPPTLRGTYPVGCSFAFAATVHIVPRTRSKETT
jgi:hypothetical protein